MRTITLKRISFNDDGTFGVLLEDGVPFMNVLEESWRDNAKGISCIPEGTYIVKRIVRPSGQRSWEVTGVPGRTAILIHPGNTEADIEGCLLPGIEWGVVEARDDQSGQIEKQPAVLRSKEACDRLDKMFSGENEFRLVISWA